MFVMIQLGILLVMVLVVPPVSTLFSRRVKGWDKVWWTLLSVIGNWFGYFAYYYWRVRKLELEREKTE
jgi:hypothetical protein